MGNPSQITMFMGQHGPQMGPMLAPWTLLSGYIFRPLVTNAAWCGSAMLLSELKWNFRFQAQFRRNWLPARTAAVAVAAVVAATTNDDDDDFCYYHFYHHHNHQCHHYDDDNPSFLSRYAVTWVSVYFNSLTVTSVPPWSSCTRSATCSESCTMVSNSWGLNSLATRLFVQHFV